MQIINESKNTVLAEEAIVANTLSARLTGLLDRKELKVGHALVLMPCNSIHTFFMRFTIDVIFVDKHNRVIKTIPTLQPFRLTHLYFNSAFAIELPAGIIRATFTQEGDIISLT